MANINKKLKNLGYKTGGIRKKVLKDGTLSYMLDEVSLKSLMQYQKDSGLSSPPRGKRSIEALKKLGVRIVREYTY